MPSRISQMRNAPIAQQNQQPSQQLQINEEYLNQLKAIMRSKNAMQFLTEVAISNPQFKQILEFAKTNNLQSLYENMARQKNVDPDQLIKFLTN